MDAFEIERIRTMAVMMVRPWLLWSEKSRAIKRTIPTYIYIYIYMYVFVHVCIYIYTHMYTSVYTTFNKYIRRIDVLIDIYIYISVYTCSYLSTSSLSTLKAQRKELSQTNMRLYVSLVGHRSSSTISRLKRLLG